MPHAGVEAVKTVGIFGIGEDVGVIPGALAKVIVIVDELPLLAAIVRAVEAAFLGFNLRPDAIRIGRRNSDADLSQNPGRKTVALEMFPSRAAITGAIEPAARAATDCAPW